jgi:hypothetical protein
MDVVLSTDLPPPYGSYLHYLQSIILSSIDGTVHQAMVSSIGVVVVMVVVVIVVVVIVVVVCCCIQYLLINVVVVVVVVVVV